MPRQYSTVYTIGFAGVICIVCSLLVSSLAVSLEERQESNEALDLRKNVLMAAGFIKPGDRVSEADVNRLFADIESVVIDIKTGEITDIDPETFDQYVEMKDPATSTEAPKNLAGVRRVPMHARIYKVVRDDKLEELILPVEGKGLWSTLRGFLALKADANTVAGITFYSHAETPGLGGEIDNPKWKALWPGRRVYDDQGEVALSVKKGTAGPVEQDPYQVDGLSGATITSRGVTNLIHFWMGENGFGPFLERSRHSESQQP